MFRRPFMATLLPMLAAVTASGCGSDTIDVEKAQSEIKKGVERDSNGTIPIREIKCPESVDVEKGATFKCTATGTNGQKATVTVTQKDDKGNVSYVGDFQALIQG